MKFSRVSGRPSKTLRGKRKVLLKQLWLSVVAVFISMVTPGFAQQQEPGTPLAVSPEPARGDLSKRRRAGVCSLAAGYADTRISRWRPHTMNRIWGGARKFRRQQFGGASSPCTAYARWVASGYIEMQPFGRTLLASRIPVLHTTVLLRPQRAAIPLHGVVCSDHG